MSLSVVWDTIEGAGKGGHTPHESPDTLFSNSTGHIVDLISEGEIEGLVDGDKSLYYNEVALKSDAGTYNFKGVTVTSNYGVEDQAALRGFDDVRTSVSVSQDLPADTYKTISFPNDGTTTAVEVTIEADSFFEVQKDGDTVGTRVSFVIEKSENGGSFEVVTNGTISGKQNDTYDVDYRIVINDTSGNTAVRIKRTTPDATSLKVNNKISFKLYTKITEHKLTYPNKAITGHIFDAKQFGNQLPSRAGKYRGIKCLVPHNYDPVKRTYTGTFTGALSGTKQYTNNPAWVFYDMVTSDRYGLGQFFDSSLIDIPSLYTLGKWCDDLVPDGISLPKSCTITRSSTTATVTCTAHGYKTGNFVKIAGASQSAYNGDFYITVTGVNTFTYTVAGSPATPATGTITCQKREPRWQCNAYITDRDDAFNVLKTMVTCFRGVLFWMDGKLWAQADLPRDPVKLVTNSNVIEGTFTYSGESNRSRNSVVNVSWNDPDLFYRRAIETYEDPNLIREIGWKTVDYQGFGCTTRAQARRLAKAVLYSQEYESELVTYKASFDHMAVDGDGPTGIAPGDVILIADHERGNAVGGGRIVTVPTSSTFVGLMDITECDWGTGTGTVYLEHAESGTVEWVTCSFDESTATVTLTGSPVEPLAPNDLYIIVESGFDPEPFRVIKISEVERNVLEVAAARYDEGKFAAIYDEFQFTSENIMRVRNGLHIDPPTNLTLSENYIYNPELYIRTIEANWTGVSDEYLDYYELSYSRDDDVWVKIISGSTAARIEHCRPGTYQVRVEAVNRLGIHSQAATATITLDLTPSDLAEGEINSLTLFGALDGSPEEVIVDGDGEVIVDTDGETVIDAASSGGTTFAGRDAFFTWKVVSPTTTYLTASAIPTIADTGFTDPRFRDCVVRMKTLDGVLLREESVVDTHYTYTFEKNFVDTNGDPHRAFTIEVSYRDIFGRESLPAVLSVVNPAPEVGDVTVETSDVVLTLKFDLPNDPDLAGSIVWLSTDTGFTPDDSTRVWKASGNAVMTVNSGTTYFYRYAHYDSFGDAELNISDEGTADSGSTIEIITGATSSNVNYQSDGTTITSNVVLPYSLVSNGVTVTSGVTWTYTVLDGTVNGKTSADGAQSLSGSGSTSLTISSMATSTAHIRIDATHSVAAPPLTLTLTRIIAPAGGSGGSGSVSQTSGFATSTYPWTNFVSFTSLPAITIPAGKTATSTVILLDVHWTPINQPSLGPWDVEFKLQRSISGVWTDIGSVQHSSPDPHIQNIGWLFVSHNGTMSATIPDTGLASGATYNYRVVARIGSGSASGNSGGMRYTSPSGGGVYITCP
jgi:hypothetical protein